jgi:hypothetical protein
MKEGTIMKKPTSKSLSCVSAALALLTSATALATPSVENNCRGVKHPASGSAVMFDDACRTAFVLPPTTGIAQATAAAPTANIQFCPSVMATHKATESTTNSAILLGDKIAKMISDFAPLDGEVKQLGERLTAASAEKSRTQAEFDASTSRRVEIIAEVAAAKTSYETCSIINLPELCTAELAALNEAKADLRTFLTSEFMPKQTAAIAAKAEYDRISGEFARKTVRLAEVVDPLFALQTRLYELQDRMLDVYNRYAAMEGASVQVLYSIPWEKVIQDYQSVPENRGINFERLPITDGRFDAQALINNTASTVPAIMDYAIPGVSSESPLHMPAGTGAIKMLSGPVSPPSSPNAVSTAFGGSVSAGLLTSLLGACPFYPDGGTTAQNLNELTSRIIANASYDYEVVAHRGYTARYNLANWLSRVERKIKKGGFLSASALQEIQEDGNSSDWFSIEFDQDKVKFPYTDAEKTRIAAEARGQLIERALRLVALQNGSLPGRAGSVVVPPRTGAGAAAAYLQGCGYFSWCMAGSFIFGTLDSLFGSSQAVQTFRRSNNVWVNDRVVDTTVLLQTGRLTFTKPQ